mmetsp:Transcript_57494/g.136763  ORF Transcript_57494/g.136763 Transcript_57494/m.136763 type:complete len:611 (-) Transcript_57494:126-1958(-)
MQETDEESDEDFVSENFATVLRGHWLDSLGNSILVSKYAGEDDFTAVLTPISEHASAEDKKFKLRLDKENRWWCGCAKLELADEAQGRLVWKTEDGRRSVWSRTEASDGVAAENVSFPWLLNNATWEPWMPLEVSRDILYDAARVTALLDIRQMMGSRSEAQERVTQILMDHDLALHPRASRSEDYLIPSAESPQWLTVPDVTQACQRSIAQRIQRIPHESYAHQIQWSGENEVWVGHHKITCRARDIQILESRWGLESKDDKSIEMARLLALYSVFDNPMSNRRSGLHLGIDPDVRSQCDYELFASPLNAQVPNGHFASKWPQHEWRFGSIGSYPSVISYIPYNSIVCVNPPFTDNYLADVMQRLPQLKLRFRLRIAVPIQEAHWRKKLFSLMPSAQLLQTYYDASADHTADVLHPTLFWEDPRCSAPSTTNIAQSLAGPLSTTAVVVPSSSAHDLQALVEPWDPLEGCSTAASFDRDVPPNSARALSCGPGGVVACSSASTTASASGDGERLSGSGLFVPPVVGAKLANQSSGGGFTPTQRSSGQNGVLAHGGASPTAGTPLAVKEAPAVRQPVKREESPPAKPLDAQEWPALGAPAKKPANKGGKKR